MKVTALNHQKSSTKLFNVEKVKTHHAQADDTGLIEEVGCKYNSGPGPFRYEGSFNLAMQHPGY